MSAVPPGQRRQRLVEQDRLLRCTAHRPHLSWPPDLDRTQDIETCQNRCITLYEGILLSVRVSVLPTDYSAGIRTF